MAGRWLTYVFVKGASMPKYQRVGCISICVYIYIMYIYIYMPQYSASADHCAVQVHFAWGFLFLLDSAPASKSRQSLGIIVFSVDYFTKLCCAPFVRMELVEAHKNFFCTEEWMEIQRVIFTQEFSLQDAQSISPKSCKVLDLLAITKHYELIWRSHFTQTKDVNSVGLQIFFEMAASYWPDFTRIWCSSQCLRLPGSGTLSHKATV